MFKNNSKIGLTSRCFTLESLVLHLVLDAYPNLQRAQYRTALVVPLNFLFLFLKEENNVGLSVFLS